jgi:hypothetical protein
MLAEYRLRLTATMALLTGRYWLSKREAAPCLADLIYTELAVGMISATEQTGKTTLTAVQAAAMATVDGPDHRGHGLSYWPIAARRAHLTTLLSPAALRNGAALN